MHKQGSIFALLLALALAASGCAGPNGQTQPLSSPGSEPSSGQESGEDGAIDADSRVPEENVNVPAPEPSGEDSGENAWDSVPESVDINSAPVEDLTDLAAVTAAYVWPLMGNGAIWSDSWSTPSEISADHLVYACAFNRLVDFDSENPIAPAEPVEIAIQTHFDVTGEYLQTASSYRAEDNTYWMPESDGGWVAVATAAEQQGERIAIEIGLLGPEETAVSEPIGTLTVELEDGHIVKYVSYIKYP